MQGSVEVPGAPGDDAAAAAVRVGPPASPAVVVGMAAAVAGDAVAGERAVAYEPLSAVGAVQEAAGVLRFHVGLVVLVDALPYEAVAGGSRGPEPRGVSAVDADESPLDVGIGSGDGRWRGHGGDGQKEQKEGEAESHAGRRRESGVWGGGVARPRVPSLPTEGERTQKKGPRERGRWGGCGARDMERGRGVGFFLRGVWGGASHTWRGCTLVKGANRGEASL